MILLNVTVICDGQNVCLGKGEDDKPASTQAAATPDFSRMLMPVGWGPSRLASVDGKSQMHCPACRKVAKCAVDECNEYVPNDKVELCVTHLSK